MLQSTNLTDPGDALKRAAGPLNPHSPLGLLAVLTAAMVACATPGGPVPASPQAPADRATPATATPGAPGLAVFYGSVTADGGPPFEGLTIVVDIDEIDCGSGTVRAGRYELAVASERERRGCGKPEAPVVFRLVGAGDGPGRAFDQKGAWQPLSQKLDLTVRTR